MKTIYIHEFVSSIQRNSERILGAGMLGKVTLSICQASSVMKVTPPTLVIDAIISVFSAFRSYLDYKKAREITKQLEYKLKEAEEFLAAKKAELEQYFETQKLQVELHYENILRQMLKNEEKMKILRKIYDESGENLKLISRMIKEYKKTHLGDEKLRELERKYIEAVHARMKMTHLLIGG